MGTRKELTCKVSAHILRWVFGGCLYGLLEIAWRGYTHWTMVLLAAFLCIPLDIANEHIPWDMSLPLQGVLVGYGRMGLLQPVWKYPWADLPIVYHSVVSAGDPCYRGVRLVGV